MSEHRGNNTIQLNGNAAPENTNTQTLTEEARTQIPYGPSNTTTYISNYETAEDAVMGVRTTRGKEDMTRKMAEWDANWSGIGGQ